MRALILRLCSLPTPLTHYLEAQENRLKIQKGSRLTLPVGGAVKSNFQFPQLPSRKKPAAAVVSVVTLSLLSLPVPSALNATRPLAGRVISYQAAPPQSAPIRMCVVPPTVKKGSLSGEAFVDRLLAQLKARAHTVQAAVLENASDPA